MTYTIIESPKPVHCSSGRLLNLEAQEIIRVLQALAPGHAKRAAPVSCAGAQALRNWIRTHGPQYRMHSEGDTIYLWREETR